MDIQLWAGYNIKIVALGDMFITKTVYFVIINMTKIHKVL